jgi:hypothetical protein
VWPAFGATTIVGVLLHLLLVVDEERGELLGP